MKVDVFIFSKYSTFWFNQMQFTVPWSFSCNISNIWCCDLIQALKEEHCTLICFSELKLCGFFFFFLLFGHLAIFLSEPPLWHQLQGIHDATCRASFSGQVSHPSVQLLWPRWWINSHSVKTLPCLFVTSLLHNLSKPLTDGSESQTLQNKHNIWMPMVINVNQERRKNDLHFIWWLKWIKSLEFAEKLLLHLIMKWSPLGIFVVNVAFNLMSWLAVE